MHIPSPWWKLAGKSLAAIRIDLRCGTSGQPWCTISGFESMNSFMNSIRDVAGRSFRTLSPISRVRVPAGGWGNARVLAGAWGVLGGNVSTVCGSGDLLGNPCDEWSGRYSAMAIFSRRFHGSGSNWHYKFMGADLQRLPRLLVVQPRVFPHEILKAKLMEAMRLVDSLEELRGSDAPVEVQGKRRQSPYVVVQSPRSKRVSARNLHLYLILLILFSAT